MLSLLTEIYDAAQRNARGDIRPADPVSICQRKKAAVILARVFGGKGCA